MTDALMRPTTLPEAMALAKVLADSELVPKEFRGKPANCLVAMQMGAEIGLNPFQALQSIAVINGKPSIYGDAGLGVVMASGLLESIEETDADDTATCTLKRKGHERPVTRQFSMADATRIQMYESDGKGGGGWKPLAQRVTWRNHPKRMRQMRARWWALRDLFPDVLKGLRGAEELEEIIDITPGIVKDDFADLEPQERAHEADRGADTGAETAAPRVVVPAADHASTESGKPAETQSSPKEQLKAGDEPARGSALLINGKESAMAVDDPVCVFELNGVQYQTRGITKELLLELFRLYPLVNKKKGKGTAEKLAQDEFSITTRKELTAEGAEKLIMRLNEMLEPA